MQALLKVTVLYARFVHFGRINFRLRCLNRKFLLSGVKVIRNAAAGNHIRCILFASTAEFSHENLMDGNVYHQQMSTNHYLICHACYVDVILDMELPLMTIIQNNRLW
jgi:hypothetical protein